MDVFPCDLLWSYTDVYTNVVVVKENINNDKGSTALTKISVFIQQNSMRTRMKDIKMRTFLLYKSFTLRNTSCLQENSSVSTFLWRWRPYVRCSFINKRSVCFGISPEGVMWGLECRADGCPYSPEEFLKQAKDQYLGTHRRRIAYKRANSCFHPDFLLCTLTELFIRRTTVALGRPSFCSQNKLSLSWYWFHKMLDV